MKLWDRIRRRTPVEEPEMSDAAVSRLLHEVLNTGPRLECRGCGGSPEYQLSPEVIASEETDYPFRYEFLCGECLGPFMSTFADPRVVTWTVTRLP